MTAIFHLHVVNIAIKNFCTCSLGTNLCDQKNRSVFAKCLTLHLKEFHFAFRRHFHWKAKNLLFSKCWKWLLKELPVALTGIFIYYPRLKHLLSYISCWLLRELQTSWYTSFQKLKYKPLFMCWLLLLIMQQEVLKSKVPVHESI